MKESSHPQLICSSVRISRMSQEKERCLRTAQQSRLHFRGSCNKWDILFRNSRKWSHSYLSNSNYSSQSGQYSFIQASCLQHWFKNWQDLRKNRLTASTFGSAIGFWPRRRVQLWLEKIGAIEPFSGNIATCWNNIKEEEALERYKLITGKSVIFPEFQIPDKKN